MTSPTQPSSTAAAAAPPAAQALQPVSNWSYPLALSDSNAPAIAQSYFDALAGADDGFFPMGANGLWHGGIHFGLGTQQRLKQDAGVRALADGEIVAYRLDSRYPMLAYSADKKALYSTGFVLLRHKLVLPPKPKATAIPASSPSSPPKAPPAEDELVFYSLYMHLLDLDGYKAAERDSPLTSSGNALPSGASHIQRMPYWQGSKFFRVGSKAKDVQEQAPEPPAPPIPTPTEPEFSSEADADLAPAPVVPIPAPPPPSTPPRPAAAGINIRDSAGGHKIGLLPRGSEIMTVGNVTQGWAQIARITRGQPLSVLVGRAVNPRANSGWVHLNDLDPCIEPSSLDKVVVLKTPYAIKAGEVIGHVGQYLRYSEACAVPGNTRPQVHIEVFAGPELPDFLARSRERAKELPASQRTLLVVQEGARLVQPSAADTRVAAGLKLKLAGDDPKSGFWAKVQPVVVQPRPQARSSSRQRPVRGTPPPEIPQGSALWVPRSIAGTTPTAAIPAWTSFPLQLSHAQAPVASFTDVFSRPELNSLGAEATASDDKGARWWKVTVGTGEGQSATGWVCDHDHPKVQAQSPWGWPGFDVIDGAHLTVKEWLERILVVAGQLYEHEEISFKPSTMKVSESELIQKVEKAIKLKSHRSGTVTADELADAQRTPWLAEALSHLIVRYESEWGGGMEKWQQLTPLMRNNTAGWKSEMERIRKLQWWDEVKAVKGFPAQPTVYHLHPLGLVGNFLGEESSDTCMQRFKKISCVILRHEGGYTNNPNDSGGATNKGIAWHSWQEFAKADLNIDPTLENLMALTNEQAEIIYYKRYWQPKGFCKIKNEKTALIIYDWTITSGGAAREVQKVLSIDFLKQIVINNSIDDKTINAINEIDDQELLMKKISDSRKSYYTSLTSAGGGNRKNDVFLTGWINRVNDCLDVML